MNRITKYYVRGLITVALLIGSALLCTTAPLSEDNIAGAIAFRGVGIAGFLLGVFYTYRLYRNMKKGK
ncbi:MAG: hypothetical protein IJT39_01020 [Bacteroidales bacterium]|nr:hypothetical protein [Bacteroidales bacterium]